MTAEFPSLEKVVSLYRCSAFDGAVIAKRAVETGKFVWGKKGLTGLSRSTLWRVDGSRCVGALGNDGKRWHIDAEVIEELRLEVT